MPTFEGSTIQAAIQKGLTHLDLPRDAVNVEVVAEGRKGFLGIGRKPAIVSLTALAAQTTTTTVASAQSAAPASAPAAAKSAQPARPAQQTMTPEHQRADSQALKAVQDYLLAMAAGVKAPATLTLKRAAKNQLTVQFKTAKPGLLIGHHGKTINALQYLGQVYLNHHAHSKFNLLLNVGDYRQRRSGILARLAERTAREAIATGQPAMLEPMPAFERKQIHARLANSRHVFTYSEGDEPRRYVVVAPKPRMS